MNVVWGLFTAGMGLLPVLASFGVIASDDSDFGAPRWFVAAVGFLFVLVGCWLALGGLGSGPLGGLLRTLREGLLLALTSGFCATIVFWPRRVHAGSSVRGAFLALGVYLGVLAVRALWRAALRIHHGQRR